MPRPIPLPRSFFERPTLTVARQLLGQQIIKVENRHRLVGLITEVEAYIGETDLACHAKAGRTPRTSIMYGEAGHLYVYFNYGMHWMLNIVTEAKDFPAAILLRGIHLIEGVATAQERRGRPDQLTNGPAKLAQALAIDGTFNGLDLCNPHSPLYLAPGPHPIPPRQIRAIPRIGINSVPEPWLSKPWNFSYTPKTT
jgi:DNA-3-methyladenine glycosylase